MKKNFQSLLRIFSLSLLIVLIVIGNGHTFAKGTNEGVSNIGWFFPTEGVITDTYGTRGGSHKGIDIASQLGTEVYAANDGVVSKSYFSDTYGHVVFIQHTNGYETVYAHLQKRKVAEGEFVKKGKLIGRLGNSGKSTGPHLHFEVHKNGWTIDKVHAIDPFLLFGKAEVGQYKPAGIQGEYVPVFRQKKKQITYQVKPLDTLWSIAEKYHVTVEQIMDLNQMKNTIIYPKQKLIIDIP